MAVMRADEMVDLMDWMMVHAMEQM